MSLIYSIPNYWLLLPKELCSPIKKEVSFSDTVHVCLIPTRNMLKESKLCETLWWSNEDYVQFKSDFIQELKEMLEKFPNISPRDSVKLLYQPDNICYDETNFC